MDPTIAVFIAVVITVLLPVLPMLVLFRLLPNQRFTVSGPFSKLTVRASGAVGGWFVGFVGLLATVVVPSVRLAGQPYDVYVVEGQVVQKDGSPDVEPYAVSIDPPTPKSFGTGQLSIAGVPVRRDHSVPTILTLRRGNEQVSVNLNPGQPGVKYHGGTVSIGPRTFVATGGGTLDVEPVEP